MTRTRVLAATVTVVALTVSACSGAGDSDRDVSGDARTVSPAEDRDAEREVERQLSRATGAGRLIPFDTLDGALPGRRYADPVTGRMHSVSELAVMGRVTAVEPGAGFRSAPDDDASTLRLRFDDPSARWRSVHLTVVVDEVIDGRTSADELRVGLAVNPDVDLDALGTGLTSMQAVFLPLTRSEVFAYDDELWAIALDGTLLAEVRGGRLRLPAFDEEEESALLSGTGTVALLRRASGAIPR